MLYVRGDGRKLPKEHFKILKCSLRLHRSWRVSSSRGSALASCPAGGHGNACPTETETAAAELTVLPSLKSGEEVGKGLLIFMGRVRKQW